MLHKDTYSHVMIFLISPMMDFYPQFYKEIKAKKNSRVTFFVGSKKIKESVKKWCHETDTVIAIDKKSSELFTKADFNDFAIERLRKLELKYNFTTNFDFIFPNRHLSTHYIDFAPGAPIPKNSKTGNYEEQLFLIHNVVVFLENFIKNENVSLLLARAEGVFPVAASIIAKQMGIPSTFPITSRYKTYVMWASSPFLECAYLNHKFKNFNFEVERNTDYLSPPKDSTNRRREASKLSTVAGLLKKILFVFFDRVLLIYFDIIHRKSGQRVPLTNVIFSAFNSWRCFKYLEKNYLKKLDPKKKYLAFLLHVEPEFTSLTLAKEFNDTLSIIRTISKCLPAGYEVLLKEHTTNIGNKNIAYYENIRNLPNVHFVDHKLPGVQLASECEAVITVSGTIGIEATLLGKRVLTFAKRSEYRFLPNVIFCESINNMKYYMSELIAETTEKEKQMIINAGLKYREMIKQVSWDMPQGKVFEECGGIEEQQIRKASSQLDDILTFLKTKTSYIEKKGLIK